MLLNVKRCVLFALCFSLLSASILLVGCNTGGSDNNETPPPETFETGELIGDPVFLTLDTVCDDATIKANVIVAYTGKATSLPTPTRESYIFEGWYKDGDYTLPVNAEDIFTESTTLYAKWSYHSSEMESMTDPVTIEYIAYGGTIKSLPKLAEAYESGSTVSLPTPIKEGFIFNGWFTDKALTKQYSGGVINSSMRLFAKWTYEGHVEGMTLPIISISTKDNKRIGSRTIYIDCKVNVGGNDTEYFIRNASAKIRGRGNSTWTQFAKKSYRLKFDEKTDLFGLGSAKDFLLISNSFDMSQMRNYAAYTIAGLFGDEITTKCTFTHLYVNDEYLGLYLVTEHTETGKNRVNIGDGTEGGTDIGYLLEFGGGIEIDDKKYFILDQVDEYKGDTEWLTDKIVQIKSPDENVCTDEQRDYIADYVSRVHRAILTGDFETFTELCDLESFLDSFIINEVMYPSDWGYCFFMYKPAGEKLYIGPLWDYDQSAGNSTHGGLYYNELAGITIEETAEKDGWSTPSTHHWFRALKSNPEFFALARQHYIDNYDILHSLPSMIYEQYEKIVTDIALNFERWPVLGKPHWRSIEKLVLFKTQKEHVDFYVNWLSGRMTWLESKPQFNITKKDLQ